jgi:hypothetical protein
MPENIMNNGEGVENEECLERSGDMYSVIPSLL